MFVLDCVYGVDLPEIDSLSRTVAKAVRKGFEVKGGRDEITGIFEQSRLIYAVKIKTSRPSTLDLKYLTDEQGQEKQKTVGWTGFISLNENNDKNSSGLRNNGSET